jgi:ferric-dicitrate binding protein FerR (iron transport regulator)
VKKIKDYSVEDFLADNRFIKWIYTPDKEVSEFWSDFLDKNPHKEKEVEDARRILISFQILPIQVDDEAIASLRKRIDHQIDHPQLKISTATHSTARKKKFYWIAASVSVLMCWLFAWVYDFPPKNTTDEMVNVKKEFNMNHMEQQLIPKGKRLMITLNDGSRVWLNADTKLEYSKDFTERATRDVYLFGEAYFDVVEDKTKPFIVHAQGIDIKVLGTSFNVKAYNRDTKVETTLVKGKVSIEQKNASDKITLIPNQRAVFMKHVGKMMVENNIQPDVYTSWKSGILTFNDQPLNEILPVLERWFNVSIHADNAASLECRFTAKINNKTLEEVLELFKTSETISYTIEGSDVYLFGSFCE